MHLGFRWKSSPVSTPRFLLSTGHLSTEQGCTRRQVPLSPLPDHLLIDGLRNLIQISPTQPLSAVTDEQADMAQLGKHLHTSINSKLFHTWGELSLGWMKKLGGGYAYTWLVTEQREEQTWTWRMLGKKNSELFVMKDSPLLPFQP